MIRPILDWLRGRKDSAAVPSGTQTLTESGSSMEFEPQVLIQGGLADLKRITQLLQERSIDSQIIVPPSGCNT